VIARRRPDASGSYGGLAGFSRIATDGWELHLKRDFVDHAGEITVALENWRRGGETGLGNRGGGFRLNLDGLPELFVRHCRRGGLVGAAMGDVFIGLRRRPLNELSVADQAFKRGIAVAEPIGALVAWIAPALYRGFFITRAMAGIPLWDFLRTDDDPVVRRHVLEQARMAIDTMHDRGLYHADLNLHNLLVSERDENFSVIILDLDKARIIDRPVPSTLRRRNSARLIRSARKLESVGGLLDEDDLTLLAGGRPGHS